MHLAFRRSGPALLFAFLLLTFCPSVKADSYSFSVIDTTNHGYFVAGDDYGDWTVRLYLAPPGLQPCGNADVCYETYSAYTKLISYTTFLPELASDPAPIAGSGCTVSASSLPAATSFCNNGHEVLGNIDGVWIVNNNVATLAYVGAPAGSIMVTPNGNLYYADGRHENLVAGLNLSNLPAAIPIQTTTPEPGSLWLLATGTLGILGAGRRRLFA